MAAHAHDAECLIVYQFLASQRHRNTFVALILDNLGVVMPEEDAHDERDQPEGGFRRK